MPTGLFLIYVTFTLVVLYRAHKAWIWELGTGIYLLTSLALSGLPHGATLVLWSIILLTVLIVRVSAIRKILGSMVFRRARKAVPKLSKTEEEALNAGETWFEASIFRGEPDWSGLNEIETHLTEEEQNFLEHEATALCAMVDDWRITQGQDLPPNVWSFIKEKGFLGLVIPKEYGGKGFSARAHSDIVIKIASRSGVAAVTVMVPNSLGPGELLVHYGTSEQKDYYLPRLAKGLEIPCFALTEPGAGSDATSIQSEAIVMQKTVEGQTVLGLSLTLNKRWITLAPVATLIGLAVNLKDPQGLLAGKGKEGITCLLISRDTPHLEIGNRHLPGGQYFMNGTIRGEDLFVPMSSIIGGQEKAGEGWHMLVECLSIGRSISLPALGVASSSVAYVTTGAYSRIRKQFNVEIGQFEGVEEKLAEIAGLNYIVSATRLLTVAAVNADKKPSVASAITKYFNTELGRRAINAAMDVHGGRTVVEGPRNYLNNYYHSIPISVTVEGANIMTRNLLIFGQGSMACHPYIRDEFYAVNRDDKQHFTQLLWQHVHYFLKNMAKTILTAWSGGWFIKTPKSPLKRDYQRLTRLSYAYAWLADLALICLGGSLKRKERLSARLADGLSYLYLAMAVLHYAQKHHPKHEPLYHAQWALRFCFYHAQKSLVRFCHNFPVPGLGLVARLIAFPWGQSMAYPSDKLDHQLARQMMDNHTYRDTILKSIYTSGDPHQPIDRMENAFQLILRHASLYKKVSDLKRCKWTDLAQNIKQKGAEGLLTEEEVAQLLSMEEARWDAMQVDEFLFDSLQHSVIDDMKTPFDEAHTVKAKAHKKPIKQAQAID